MGGTPRQQGCLSTYVRNENKCTAKHIMKHQNTEDKKKKTSKEKTFWTKEQDSECH